MTTKQEIEKVRDEMAEQRAMRQCSSGCEWTNKVWQRHLQIGFEDGFTAGLEYALNLPEVLELRGITPSGYPAAENFDKLLKEIE